MAWWDWLRSRLLGVPTIGSMGQRDAKSDFPGEDSYMIAATLRQRRGNSSELVRSTVEDAAGHERELSNEVSHRSRHGSDGDGSAVSDVGTAARAASPSDAPPSEPQGAPNVKLAPFE